MRARYYLALIVFLLLTSAVDDSWHMPWNSLAYAAEFVGICRRCRWHMPCMVLVHGPTETATAWWSSAEASAWTAIRMTAEAAAVAALTGLHTAKEVEAVVDMKHHIAVDTVVFRIAAHRCRDVTAEVALLMENVVELQHHGQGTSSQKAL